jgi:uncharacterized protein YaaN involved in tellurite resistance
VTQPRNSPNPTEPNRTPSGFDSGSSNSAEAAQAGSPAVSPAAVERIEKLVADIVETIVTVRPDGPDEARILEAIDHLGESEFVATASISARVLDRRFRSMDGQLTGKGPMARRLAELRKVAEALDPSQIQLGPRHTPEQEFRELDRYFERFARSQSRLEAILAELRQSRFTLERDNASIESEEASLSREMEALREHVFLAERLDDALTARLDRVAATDPGRAELLRARVLAALRARRVQILTQLAIATQGYMALRLVEDSNLEVIKGVDSAIATTGAALHTAVLAAQAAASQRVAVEHLEAARQARGALADQASALEAGIAARAERTAALRSAWEEMRAALDRVEEQKARALRSISTADRELTRPKP